MPRTTCLILAILALIHMPAPPATGAEEPCSVTLQSGDDISLAASRGRVICLAAGTYNPFVLDRTTTNGVTIRGLDPERSVIQTSSARDVVVYNAPNVTLSNLTVRGPKGVYVARSTGVTLDRLRVDGAAIAVHVDDNASAKLSDVRITRAGEVGLLVRNNASVDGTGVQVLDSTLVGVAAANHAQSLTLRDSEVARAGKGPGIFAGMPGCAELEAATLDISSCFYSNLGHYVTQTRVLLEGVNVHDGPGTGLVFFPGVTADVRNLRVARWGLTGLFAWGSTVRVAGSSFDENVENAVEYRAFPDPRTNVMLRAKGSIDDTTIRRTKPWQGNVLGGGVVVQGAELSFLRTAITENAAFGIVYDNGASGQIVESRIAQNGDTGVCILPGNAVQLRSTEVTGNLNNDPRACAS
jgi:hypothetical protein